MALLVTLVLVVAVGNLVLWSTTQDDPVLEVSVFDRARPFCEAARQQRFADGVEGVATTRVGAELRSVLAGTRAEILRAVAARHGTSAPAAADLRALAALLDRAGSTGDYRAARAAAAALDREAARTCG